MKTEISLGQWHFHFRNDLFEMHGDFERLPVSVRTPLPLARGEGGHGELTVEDGAIVGGFRLGRSTLVRTVDRRQHFRVSLGRVVGRDKELGRDRDRDKDTEEERD